MDETTTKKIEKKIKYSMPSDGVYGSPDTGTLFFDWWHGGEAGTASGPNFFGVVAGWFSVKTAGDWFGYAFRLAEGLTDEERLSLQSVVKFLRELQPTAHSILQ